MPTDNKDRESPATTSYAYDQMLPKWALIDTLLGGTTTMREAAVTYLPRHSEESNENYMERLSRSTLFNMVELTLDSLVGKPFSNPIKLNEDIPPEVETLLEDIDLMGNDLGVFARNWFREGFAKAVGHVLIDFPRLTDEEREGRTREDDLKENRRPYWVHIKPENLLFAASEVIDGKETLTHIRIYEEVVEKDGFAEKVTHRIRVLEPGWFEIWDLIIPKGKRKPIWVKMDEGLYGLDEIPLVTFYADRTDFMMGKPPMEDLANLNVRHWQSTSDQINVLTVARFPMLAVAGATDITGSVMAIGPKQLLGTKDPQGRFYYVEHTGKAIAAGRLDLLDLEEVMASYGAEFLKRRPGNQTATARALNSSESISPLQDMTIRFVDSLNLALDFTAKWLDLDAGGTVDIPQDFTPDATDNFELQSLLEARKNGDLSREDYLTELKLRKVLSDDFDLKGNFMRLLIEAAESLSRMKQEEDITSADDKTENKGDDDAGNSDE